MTRIEPGMEVVEQARRTLIDLSIRYGPKVLVALLLLLAGLWVARRLSALLEPWLNRRELEPPMRQLIARLLSALIVLLFGMMALQNLGVELIPLLASLGVVGVGVGLATQGVLSNVVAGLTIIFTRPFRVGEYISLLGVEGRVESIDLFNTVLGHTDRSRVVVPNRKIVGEILHNYGNTRQLDLSVSVAFGTDLARALAVISDLLRKNPRVLQDPAPVLGVTALGDSPCRLQIQCGQLADAVQCGIDHCHERIKSGGAGEFLYRIVHTMLLEVAK